MVTRCVRIQWARTNAYVSRASLEMERRAVFLWVRNDDKCVLTLHALVLIRNRLWAAPSILSKKMLIKELKTFHHFPYFEKKRCI